MNKERLLKLAKYLGSLKVSKTTVYDQNNWGILNFKANELKVAGSKCEIKEGFCKTSACALGHAALMPEFNKAGLSVEWLESSALVDDGSKRFVAKIKLRGYDTTDEFAIGAIFFGLTPFQAEKLFGPGSMNPKDKAAQIRKMVNAAK